MPTSPPTRSTRSASTASPATRKSSSSAQRTSSTTLMPIDTGLAHGSTTSAAAAAALAASSPNSHRMKLDAAGEEREATTPVALFSGSSGTSTSGPMPEPQRNASASSAKADREFWGDANRDGDDDDDDDDDEEGDSNSDEQQDSREQLEDDEDNESDDDDDEATMDEDEEARLRSMHPRLSLTREALAKSMDAGNEDEAASAVNANDDDDDDDSASVVTALEHGKRNNVGGEETADDDDDDDEAGSGIDANASQESLASLTAAKLKRFASASYDDYDMMLEVTRKKKKVMQRDLFRLGGKFDQLKESYFRNKEAMLEEEKRLVMKGTHDELLHHTDEIQALHDSRLKTARSRYEMTTSAAMAELDFDRISAQNVMLAQRAAIRWGLLKEAYELLAYAKKEAFGEEAVPDDHHHVSTMHENVHDRLERFERIGLLPDKAAPLAVADRDFDLMHMRNAAAPNVQS